MNPFVKPILATLLFSNYAAASTENTAPEQQKLLDLIASQQEQINSLKETVEQSLVTIEDNLDQTSSSKMHLGGYGELHYNNNDEEDSIDFHRFVLFVNYEFNDRIRFVSEVEIEHALSGDDKPGEVELEQAYIEMDLDENNQLKTGLFLIPVGIINETHEPPTFYGVERNPVEKNILPTTWWEAGAGFSSKLAEGLHSDFAIHSGLYVPTDGNNSFLIRKGRQKAAEANADSLAYTARLKYTAIPGLELAASYQFQQDVTQGELGADANLFSAHAIYHHKKFGLRALYAAWNIDSAEAEVIGRDKQRGFYLEPSYRINEKFGIFARQSVWDSNAGDQSDTEKRQVNLGVNFWPVQGVVFKFDLEKRSGAEDVDGFNLGVGYQF